jgi:hypothetical protein
MSVMVPCSWGELIDKITILEIKRERVADPGRAANIAHELGLLAAIRDRELRDRGELAVLAAELAAVNRRLWDIEDSLRALEARQDFGPQFIALARSVYRENDRRSSLKRSISQLLDSDIIEEKLHTAY